MIQCVAPTVIPPIRARSGCQMPEAADAARVWRKTTEAHGVSLPRLLRLSILISPADRSWLRELAARSSAKKVKFLRKQS